jgi:hypothetical protein
MASLFLRPKYKKLFGLKRLIMNIEIQLAQAQYIPSVMSLNSKWYKENLINHSSGFLSVLYTFECITKMIANDDLYVILLESVVVGYCLVNNAVMTERSMEIKQRYLEFNPFNQDAKIGSGYQILFDTPIQNKKLFHPILSRVVHLFKQRYDVLISTVSKRNTVSINVHQCFGWNFIDAFAEYYIIEY